MIFVSSLLVYGSRSRGCGSAGIFALRAGLSSVHFRFEAEREELAERLKVA
jgi:hypothetical protein